MSSKLIYVIALLAVLFGLYGLMDMLSRNPEPAAPPQPEIQMVTLWQSNKPIISGEKIDIDDLSRVALPKQDAALIGATEDVILDLSPSTLVAQDIEQGQWVFPEQLSQPGDANYLDLLTEEGMVLYPLTISATNLVDNYIHPGDYIDILTVSSPHTNLSNATAELTEFNGVQATLLMQRVRVMAIDNESNNGVKPKVGINGELETTIVIEVMPNVVSKLSLAQRTMFIEIYRSHQEQIIPDADVSDVISNYTGIRQLRGSQANNNSTLGGVL